MGGDGCKGQGKLMLQRLETEPLWVREYEEFVAAVSFGPVDKLVSLDAALCACQRLFSAL